MHTASLLMFLTFPCITQLLEQPPQLAVLAQERGTAGLPGSEALRAGPWAALQALSLTVALGIPLAQSPREDASTSATPLLREVCVIGKTQHMVHAAEKEV